MAAMFKSRCDISYDLSAPRAHAELCMRRESATEAPQALPVTNSSSSGPAPDERSLSFSTLHEPDHARHHESNNNDNGKRFKRPCAQNF